ncbi:MAG: class I SAM-dependent methyltransferase [Candidatus Bipolaricaulia bacterium]
MSAQEPLYSKDAAEALTQRERSNQRLQERIQLVLSRLGECESFLDIGCGSGQYLRAVAAHGVRRVVGIDESPDRLAEARRACPHAELHKARADSLPFSDRSFDVVLAAQVLHEIYLFGQPDELAHVFREIQRVLKPNGRLIALDHLDPGPERVRVRLSPPARTHFDHFITSYKFRTISFHQEPDGTLWLSRRDLQDFVTKIWSFGTAMEDLEMRETHCPFGRAQIEALVRAAQLTLIEWLAFEEISEDCKEYGIELVEGSSWPRKFLVVAQR